MIKVRENKSPKRRCHVCRVTPKNVTKKFYLILLRGACDSKRLAHNSKFTLCNDCLDLLSDELIDFIKKEKQSQNQLSSVS